jgi:hypothetical protein
MRRPLNAQLAWLLWNSVFAVGLYLGVWLEVTLIGYAVAAFVWLMVATYFLVLYGASQGPQRSPPVPRVVGWVFDVAVLTLLVSCHWYWTATGFAIAAIALELVHRKSKAQESALPK